MLSNGVIGRIGIRPSTVAGGIFLAIITTLDFPRVALMPICVQLGPFPGSFRSVSPAAAGRPHLLVASRQPAGRGEHHPGSKFLWHLPGALPARPRHLRRIGPVASLSRHRPGAPTGEVWQVKGLAADHLRDVNPRSGPSIGIACLGIRFLRCWCCLPASCAPSSTSMLPLLKSTAAKIHDAARFRF